MGLLLPVSIARHPLTAASPPALRRHIVALRGVGFSDQSDFAALRSSMFVVQEYMAGGTLYDLILRAMSYPRKQVSGWRQRRRWGAVGGR